MPAKTARFYFDVPINQLLALVAAGHSELRIDIMGDNKPPRKVIANGAPALLEPPRRHRNGTPIWQLMLKTYAADPKSSKTNGNLREAIAAEGFSKGSFSSQLDKLLKRGFIKRVEKGCYQITAKGVAAAEKLGADHG